MSKETELNINYMLRHDFETFVSERMKELKHVYMNFDKILFIKSEINKAVEIYKVDGFLKSLLPDYVYLVVASDKYNYLGTKKLSAINHTLKHIPEKFNGELLPHDYEIFEGEKIQ